ncbi:MAG: FtsX-like permease family protein [Acidimicrobiales bacterium]
MIGTLRRAWMHFRRAPGRITASVLALTLAVAAIGVLAIPTISEGSLHRVVASDALGDIIVATTPLQPGQINAIAALDGVQAAEGQLTRTVALHTADTADTDGTADTDDTDEARTAILVGLAEGRTMDQVRLVEGRRPVKGGEVLVGAGTAPIGSTVSIDGTPLQVVGQGRNLWWSDTDVVFVDLQQALALSPDTGINRLVIAAEDDRATALRDIVDRVRPLLHADGDTFLDFPIYLPGGTTPIDRDIRQVSTLIGLLGLVAAAVALVLLASTTNTLITERTREVAVMRALGGRQRALRRRLRRLALGITATSLLLGIPLGIALANIIARMVLERFVGLTPDVAVNWWVVAGSAAAMMGAARLVAARAAQRVTRGDLAAALRDRDGAPFGHRTPQRWLARLALGSMANRLALRGGARKPGRTVGVTAQIATAVGAALLIFSLTASVNRYNEATQQPWQWESRSWWTEPGLGFDGDLAEGRPGMETGIATFGELDGLEVDTVGLAPGTVMFNGDLSEGRWFSGTAAEVTLSAGFARHRDLAVGQPVTVELASGSFTYQVVGLVDDHGRAVYLNRDRLATDLGAPGQANVIWSKQLPSTEIPSDADVTPLALPAAAQTETRAEVDAAARAGRDAIVAIFGAIALIVAGVATLAVASSLTVALYERRHELATLAALGAPRRRLRGLLIRELLPLGVVGVGVGLVLGQLGTAAIIGSFERSNAVDIGTIVAWRATPILTAASLVMLMVLGAMAVRRSSRRSIALTLRSAA